jgi:hypothetical protein
MASRRRPVALAAFVREYPDYEQVLVLATQEYGSEQAAQDGWERLIGRFLKTEDIDGDLELAEMASAQWFVLRYRAQGVWREPET